MENALRNRLDNALLTLNYFNANEKGTTAAERHWIIEQSSELNQPFYFKDMLTLPWKDRTCVMLGKGFCSCFHGRRKIMDTININKYSV